MIIIRSSFVHYYSTLSLLILPDFFHNSYFLECPASPLLTEKPVTCLQNKSVPPELSMYLEAGMFHKSWYQYLQVLTFTASFWMTVRNLQILLFSRMQQRQSFAILIIWIRAFLSQMLIIAVS